MPECQSEASSMARSHEINAAAADYFARRMTITVDGEACVSYLSSRGLTLDDATLFGIGSSGPDRVSLAHALGCDDGDLVDAGLLVDRDGRIRPRFRNRLMFPIHDADGAVVGFSGRALDDSEPKYLNSPASDFFVKGELLYNLHRAVPASRKSGRMLVVEGNFDAIRVSLTGIAEVVAPLGTAMTQAQAAIIEDNAHTAYLMFDNDTAGRRATFKAGDLLLATGMAVNVVRIPEGEDPDSLVAKIGKPGLVKLIAEAPDVLDRKIELLDESNLFRDIARKRESIERLLPTLRAATGPLRDFYVDRVAAKTGVRASTLVDLLPKPSAKKKSTKPKQQPAWERDLATAVAS